MTLKQWITETGRANVCAELKVTQATLTLWLKKKSAPKDKVKIKINRLSHGKVSYAEMIEPFHGDMR